jgi:hypothetical protein
MMEIYLSEEAEAELIMLGAVAPHRYEELARALRLVARSGFSAGGFAFVRRYEDGLSRFYHPILNVNLYVSEDAENTAQIVYVGVT